jgi:hypothetical protein
MLGEERGTGFEPAVDVLAHVSHLAGGMACPTPTPSFPPHT